MGSKVGGLARNLGRVIPWGCASRAEGIQSPKKILFPEILELRSLSPVQNFSEKFWEISVIT